MFFVKKKPNNCQANLEMSYGKVVIILRFSGEYFGIRGHYHVKPTRTYKVAHSAQDTKQKVIPCFWTEVKFGQKQVLNIRGQGNDVRILYKG